MSGDIELGDAGGGRLPAAVIFSVAFGGAGTSRLGLDLHVGESRRGQPDPGDGGPARSTPTFRIDPGFRIDMGFPSPAAPNAGAFGDMPSHFRWSPTGVSRFRRPIQPAVSGERPAPFRPLGKIRPHWAGLAAFVPNWTIDRTPGSSASPCVGGGLERLSLTIFSRGSGDRLVRRHPELGRERIASTTQEAADRHGPRRAGRGHDPSLGPRHRGPSDASSRRSGLPGSGRTRAEQPGRAGGPSHRQGRRELPRRVQGGGVPRERPTSPARSRSTRSPGPAVPARRISASRRSMASRLRAPSGASPPWSSSMRRSVPRESAPRT